MTDHQQDLVTLTADAADKIARRSPLFASMTAALQKIAAIDRSNFKNGGRGALPYAQAVAKNALVQAGAVRPIETTQPQAWENPDQRADLQDKAEDQFRMRRELMLLPGKPVSITERSSGSVRIDVGNGAEVHEFASLEEAHGELVGGR